MPTVATLSNAIICLFAFELSHNRFAGNGRQAEHIGTKSGKADVALRKFAHISLADGAMRYFNDLGRGRLPALRNGG
ncbi:hypothetical protein [Bosea sp. OK403]|uniref:hypothetical protein n=1 Tax=Bosea sp. OK403 TaxID=1855286 RepID=UPI00111355AD|nr:hypothetical protein [Bosea sp. OK403]